MCLAGHTSDEDGYKVNITLIKFLSREILGDFVETPLEAFEFA
jgi:hypothetical protein